jgi:two-component sensor histidine kinase
MAIAMEQLATGGSAANNDCAWLLLTEFNHRLRDELTFALATLRSTQRAIRNQTQSSRSLDQALARLERFGQVHHLLDRSQNHSPLRLRLEALCWAITESLGAPRGINVVFIAENVVVDDETAWTVCVVASELMIYALKRDFQDVNDAILTLRLYAERGWVFLIVHRDNVSFTSRDGRSITNKLDLCLEIVSALAQRIDGTVTCEYGPKGTTMTFGVPVLRVAQ